MGCFLACFGSSKDRRRRKQRHKVQAQPRVQQINSDYNVQSSVSLVQDYSEKSSSPVSVVRGKPEEQPQQHQSPNARKKGAFDAHVKTYEHVLLDEVPDFSQQNEEENKKEREEYLAKSSHSESSSDHSSITSSSSSYPPNHRYQNCRESDYESDELDYEESDLHDDDYGALDYEYFDEDLDDGILESKTTSCGAQIVNDDIDGSVEEVVQPISSSRGARDRSVYVHAVLNPVENLTQWKALKARGAASLKKQKENFNLHQESRVSFSSEPGFKELSFSDKSKPDYEPSKLNEEVAVDASLSNWLSSSETTPVKSSTVNASTPGKNISQGSNSMTSLEDRPILGALTLEEIKQFSASSSPRKSPSRRPGEMPIIGSVGTYWSHNSTIRNSNSATSFKGISNTTSKYREVFVK